MRLSVWISLLCAVGLLAGPVAQAQRKTTAKATAKAAPKKASAPATLAALVRAYRESPSAARRAAVESWGVAHPKDRASVELALGVVAYEHADYPAAIAALRRARPALPGVADYTGYYLAASRVESRDFGAISADLAGAHNPDLPSPLAARAWLLEARALRETAPAEAVRTLRAHAAELPQPEGDLSLGESLQAAGDLAGAAEVYQRVYCQYVTGEAAVRVSTALAALRSAMGASYPSLSLPQYLHHADRLMEVREFAQARTEYRAIVERASGTEHDQALVRLEAIGYLSGNAPDASEHLGKLEVAAPEAEAERLYYLVECSRRLDDDGEVKRLLKRLQSEFATSPWRLKALISGANYFLLSNHADEFVPLYRAVYEDFPNEPAAANSHWKVAFEAYVHRRSEAAQLLRDQLLQYPRNPNAAASLYFLGRIAEERKDFAEAAAYYQHLLKLFENYYYAMLVRERVLQPEFRKAVPSPEALAFLASVALPAAKPVPLEPTRHTTLRLERSQLLRAAGFSDLADSELRFGARTDGQPALLGMEAARAADSPGQALHVLKTMVPDNLAIPLASAPRSFWELLYPLPYREDLFADARAHDLDPYLVAGLIRQESEFSPRAVSPAKAYGLMQVLPVTGRQYARKAGIPRFYTALLLQPAVNLKIGTMIFRDMLDHSRGHAEQTLAAYNAGPMRLAEWVTWNSPHEPAEFVESIPFTETREYVQAVLRNADMYRRLYP
jgi:soluble lytic murein transglycosylase